MGLYALKRLIMLNGGEMVVLSNDAYMKVTSEGEQYHRHRASFTGTVVNISLNCDADEARYCLSQEN